MNHSNETEAMDQANTNIETDRDKVTELVGVIMANRTEFYKNPVAELGAAIGQEIVFDIIRQFYAMGNSDTSPALTYDIWKEIAERWAPAAGEDRTKTEKVLIPAIIECVRRLSLPIGVIVAEFPATFQKGCVIQFTLYKDYGSSHAETEPKPELSADTKAIIDAIEKQTRAFKELLSTPSMSSIQTPWGRMPMQPMPTQPPMMMPMQPMPPFPMQFTRPSFYGQGPNPQSWDRSQPYHPQPFFGPYAMTPPPYPFGNNPQQQETFYPRSHDRFQPNRFDKMSDNYQLIKVVVQAILDRINVCGPESFFMSKIVSSIVPGGIDVCELDHKAWKKILEGVGRFHDGVYKLDVRPATTTSGIRGVEIHIS